MGDVLGDIWMYGQVYRCIGHRHMGDVWSVYTGGIQIYGDIQIYGGV